MHAGHGQSNWGAPEMSAGLLRSARTLVGVEQAVEVLDVAQAVAAQLQAGAGEAQAVVHLQSPAQQPYS
jgi:hypothetical protein